MARICLAVTRTRGSDSLLPYQEALQRAGHSVELVTLPDGSVPPAQPTWPWNAGARGASAWVFSAWANSSADLLLALDFLMGYPPEAVLTMVDHVLGDPEPVALSSRCLPPFSDRNALRRLLAILSRSCSGTTDLFSGLLAVSRPTFSITSLRLAPVGDKPGLEFLIKCPQSTRDVSVTAGKLRRGFPRGLDDWRQLKRLVNDRRGNLSRLAQFCLVGASGMIVDLSLFALFSGLLSQTNLALRTIQVLGEPLAWSWVAAAACSILVALIWNFTLNRRLTFSDSRHDRSIPRQFISYALGNAVAVSLSFLIRLGLPLQLDFFAQHRLFAAAVGVIVATGVSFSMSRWFVFRPTDPIHATKSRRSRPSLSRRSLAKTPGHDT